MILNTEQEKLIGLDHKDLLFDTNIQIPPNITVKRLTSPSSYFIHCDLVDKEQNLLNGNPSSVLARFDIKGSPFQKVTYQAPPLHVLRDTSTGYHVNSLTISVRDGNGALFDFQGLPLEFELEIN